MKHYKLIAKYLLTLSVFYIIISALLFYIFSFSITNKNYNYAVSTHIHSIQNRIDTYLNENKHIMSNLSTDEAILSYLSSNHTPASIISASQALQKISKPINSSFDNILVYTPNDNKLITPVGTYNIDIFSSSIGIEPDYFKQVLNSCVNDRTKKAAFIPSSINISGSKNDYLTLIYYYRISSQKSFVMISVYDRNTLLSTDLLKDIRGISMIVFPDGTIISDCDFTQDRLNSIITNPGIKYKSTAHNSVSTYFWGDIELYFYASRWNYIIYSNAFFPIWIFITLAFILLGLIIAKHLSGKIYAPVNNLMNELTLNENYNNSIDEMKFIQASINSLQTENKSMSEYVDKYKLSLVDKFFLEMLTITVPHDKVRSTVLSLSLENIPFPLIAFTIEIKNYEVLSQSLNSGGLFEVQKIVKSIFEQECKQHKFFKMLTVNHDSYVALISIDNYDDFKKYILPILFSIEKQLSIVLLVVVGGIIESWSDFDEVQNVFISVKQQNILINDENLIIFPTDISKKTIDNINYTTEFEQKLITNVLSANENIVFENVSELIDTNMKNKLLTNTQYSSFIVMLYATVSKIITRLNKTEQELYGTDYAIYLELKQCLTAGALKTKYYEILNVIMEYIKINTTKKEDSFSKIMIAYIENHYTEDISLLTLAEHMNMSQYYISKLFKSCMGENFKDYLAKYRLDIAIKQMRKDPSKKIVQIAADVGLNSVALTRLFTKYYNTTPSKYMQNIGNE